VTGKNYSGANVTDTCAIASCDTGYHLNPGLNLTETIGNTAGTAYGYINHSGTYGESRGSTTSQATYGISAPDTWGVDYGSTKGRITGKALCSTQVGDNQHITWTNPTTNATMTPEFGTEGAQYCYCTIDSYTSSSGTSQSLSAPWVFYGDGVDEGGCAEDCAYYCVNYLWHDGVDALHFRAAVFASLGAPVASCDANVINITWDSTDASEIEANNAGSVTYDGNINTPRKAQHRNGYIFTGWTFNTPNP
jgi:hypothetical protein